jgi:hypothetical protein
VPDVAEDTLKTTLDGWCAEVTALRFGITLPATESGPGEVLSTLVAVRANLDRVEGLLARVHHLKARAERAVAAAEAIHQDAWDQASATTGKSRGTDYSGARERYADNNLATLAQKRTVRRSVESLSMVEEAYEVIRMHHRGIDGVRMDIHRIVSALSIEYSIDRQGVKQ